jgi:cytoskeletal protein RodZ
MTFPGAQARTSKVDKRRMEAFFSWVAAGFGALFVVAVAVAWWEHLVRNTRPLTAPEAVAPRVMKVDVPLDTAAGLLLPASDGDERRAALGDAMDRIGRVGRAARAEGGISPDAWTETSPMVLQAAPEAAAPPPTSRV